MRGQHLYFAVTVRSSSHPKTNKYWGFVWLLLALITNYNWLYSWKWVKNLLRPFWSHFSYPQSRILSPFWMFNIFNLILNVWHFLMFNIFNLSWRTPSCISRFGFQTQWFLRGIKCPARAVFVLFTPTRSVMLSIFSKIYPKLWYFLHFWKIWEILFLCKREGYIIVKRGQTIQSEFE